MGFSFSRIHDRPARELTPYLWEKVWDRPLPALTMRPIEVLTHHLDPYDVEDLIYVWLQVARNYLALPRSRLSDTPVYEWTMIHRVTGRRAIVQIKTGSDPVDLVALAAAVSDAETDTYAFASSAEYEGPGSCVTEIITTEGLLAFVTKHMAFLPARVRTWFELA